MVWSLDNGASHFVSRIIARNGFIVAALLLESDRDLIMAAALCTTVIATLPLWILASNDLAVQVFGTIG